MLWIGLALRPGPSHAEQLGVPPTPVQNFYGQVGLLDTPSANFQPDGMLSMTASFMPAMERYSVGFQALPWLETAFRYSRVDRWLLHTDDYDRSLGVKIRLSSEGEYWPSIAIGFQDILGTGGFGAEYIVASKREGDFDFTLGMGWRRMSGLASFENPFSLLSKSFSTTPGDTGLGGKPLLSQFFHGPNAGLFGGVTWDTPIDGLTLIAEASGDRHTQQQMNGGIDVRTPFNIGFAYHPWPSVQIGGGYLYGSQASLAISFRLDPFEEPPKPRLGEQPLPITTRVPNMQQDAVLSLLQDSSNFYTQWSAPEVRSLPPAVASAATTRSSLANNLFEAASFQKLHILGVDSFGKSFLVSLAGRQTHLNCASFQNALESARANGFQEIVFSSQESSTVVPCSAPSAAASEPHPTQYASNTTLEEAVDAAPDQPEAAAPAPAATMDASPAADTRSVADNILDDANLQRVGVYSLQISQHEVDLAFYNSRFRTDTEAIGRLLRVLMKNAPPNVELFRLLSVINDIPITQMVFSRSDLERVLNAYGSASELLPLSQLSPAPASDPLTDNPTQKGFPYFGYSITPGYRQSLFDPDEPFRYEIYGAVGGYAKLTHNFSLEGMFEFNIVNTVQQIQRTSNSVLPHVRSDFASYYKNGINGIGFLQASYITKLSDDLYGYAKAGLIEDMFAGLGGELYWQPAHKRWSLGVDLYAVQQRGFDRLFELRPYRVIVGHVSLYYRSPFYDLNFAVHAGRYLAGDYGATFEATRRFASGVEVGAYFTLTNVPFSKFGEGSFDKGVILRIPLDNLLPVDTQEVANLDFKPLTRDGGQPLDGEYTLHGAIQRSSEGELLQTWDEVLHP